MTAKIRVIIADDEGPARARLRQLFREQPDFHLVGECSNGRQAVEMTQKEKPDLLFLDVQMPRLNGLEACQALAQLNIPLPRVIFVTAYDQYALKAFELHAIDYLLKPFDRQRFEKCLEHARSQLSKTELASSQLKALLESLQRNAKQPARLVFRQNGRVIFLQAEQIDWVEADGNYVKIH